MVSGGALFGERGFVAGPSQILEGGGIEDLDDSGCEEETVIDE